MRGFVLLASLLLVGCVSPRKCAEKFPAKTLGIQIDTIYQDSTVYLFDTLIIPSIRLNTEFFDVKDTVIQNDSLSVEIQKKGNKIKVVAKTKELKKIDSLKFVLHNKTIVIQRLEQMFFDQKVENKRLRDSLKFQVKTLKAERKPETQRAKAAKWQTLATAVKSIILLLLLLIAMLLLSLYFLKSKK